MGLFLYVIIFIDVCMRKIENTTYESINKLVNKIQLGIISTLNDYKFLFGEEELNILKSALLLIKEYLNTKSDELLKKVLDLEYSLKPLVFRCFEYEKENGSSYISWLKNDKYNPNKGIVSVTFGNVLNTFC